MSQLLVPEYMYLELLLGVVIGLVIISFVIVFMRLRARSKNTTQIRLPDKETIAEISPEASPEEITEEIEIRCPDEIAIEQLDRAEKAVTEVIEKPEERFFERLKNRLSKTHDALVGRVDRLLSKRTALNTELYEDLEEILMTADMGVKTSYELLSTLQQELDKSPNNSLKVVRDILKQNIYTILSVESKPFDPTVTKPFVIMVVGVNGVGKTTTIGKLAAKLGDGARKTMIVAADTFRAAAIEQLEFWSKKVGTDFISQKQGADPSAVAYDAIHAALSRGTDIIIIDTAGRLHTKINLIEELKKVKRIIARELMGAPHEILLVLDATTGQNAIVQARTFHEALEVTGLILTKLDGTAKGGVIVGIANELKLPIRYIGIGEALEDLTEFDPRVFLDALF